VCGHQGGRRERDGGGGEAEDGWDGAAEREHGCFFLFALLRWIEGKAIDRLR
jgi:hypothetical protein